MENDKQPILSICIPTYNRADLLNHNLEVLDGFKNKNFKLIICDNGSTDGTQQVISKWISKFPYHQLIRHDVNIFYDRNVASGLRAFNTEYCFLLGDGCLIDEDSLNNLQKELEHNTWDAVIIDAFGQVNLAPRVYTDVNIMLREIGWYLPLVSSCIFSKKVCNELFLQRYYDSQFEPYGVLVEYLCSVNSFKVKYINNVKLTLNRAGSKAKTGWHGHPFRTFGKEWYTFIMSLPIKISYETKQICLWEHDAHIHVFNVWSLFKAKLRGDVMFYDYKDARPILPFVLNHPLWLYDIIYMIPTLPTKIVALIKSCRMH